MPRKSSDRFARYVPAIQLFAARLVLFHQKVADQLGLTATEFKCFRLLQHLGPLALTALAQEAGLQLGTASGLIDRLEAAGFVSRQRDEVDKRRLLLIARKDASARVDPLYREQGEAMAAHLDGYSAGEFDLLMSFLTEAGDILARSQRTSQKVSPSKPTSRAKTGYDRATGRPRRSGIAPPDG